jgi:internalin A
VSKKLHEWKWSDSRQHEILNALIKNASDNKAVSLNLSYRGLTELPEQLCELTGLQSLDLMGNRLTALPDSLGRLTDLRRLFLNGNQLASLPESLKDLTQLQELYLHGNPLLELPTEILGNSWQDVFSMRETQPANPARILDYYFRVLRGRRPLNEAKLILVGSGAVGKTSVVNRLVYGRFDPDEVKTQGIQITQCRIMLNGNEDVRLNIWDFGGQEIMHATHQFFLTQRSLYLLVLNGREGGEDAAADYWLKLIESFGGGSPVIVVLNKVKQHPFDVNRRALQQKYPPAQAFIKTDCEDGTGIEELRKVIERVTDQLDDLRAAFPAAWFSIKNQLAAMKENYLDFGRYQQICLEHGERDPAAHEALASHLHNLGIVLNYKDDPRLQDTHVLNPHWVTNGIYQILNARKLAEQRGEISLSDLSGVLDPVEYPRTMRGFIMDLMKKFELCFSFPDDETHYLIPELLDKQEPPEAAAFRPEECLNFRYYYPVLPEGLLPRFIVRTHDLSEGLARWRTGVILKFEENRALVKADVQDKKVFIYVSGPVNGRRRLLAIIRSDFERIHHDIRNLHPQEMVPLPAHPSVAVPYTKLLAMERAGIPIFPDVAGHTVININVGELLNGVDFESARELALTPEEERHVPLLFCSYSHKDEALRNELETHLKLLQRQGLVETWHDRKIEAGEDWRQKIDEKMERADLILFLVSSDFIASDYCYEREMARALERHDAGEARVIPVIVRDVNWARAPFARLQALPAGGLPVTRWPDRDSAWRGVAEGIERVVLEARKKLQEAARAAAEAAQLQDEGL